MDNLETIKKCNLTLKNRLKEIRKEMGLSQKQLAEKANVSR
ncbi:MAG: helix-turn-helix domain-containing protein [Muribaculaceae bacterium]|nr:helix-turn-helix domain-containing protein [Muribaculaceae bacterium]MCM1478980.1 helix-turn-helix domain-containing protein [Muribaculaceae bacterium]